MSPFLEFLTTALQLDNDRQSTDMRYRGGMAERQVYQELRMRLPRDYIILNNLLLPISGSIGSSQIDHVVISRFGIFCIETKAHSGAVYGDIASDKLSVYYSGTKYDMLNPVRQNRSHVQALCQLLGYSHESTITPLSVLTQARSVKVYGSEDKIHSIDSLVRFIANQRLIVYSNEEVLHITHLLRQADMSSDAQRISLHRSQVSRLQGL